MPIYEYFCENCKKKQEFLQEIDEDPINECPLCKSKNIKKMVSVSSFKLKGSGWYETDFKNPPSKKNNNSAKTKD
ncbi:MAG: zinc ribbon domain-containing protein [Deltaproteobacteria bacterium]|jgi:putative FmdB family regulatory protein|nr:zinc ribbon domain-containing protein [Deltaproteobacteria bacterium]